MQQNHSLSKYRVTYKFGNRNDWDEQTGRKISTVKPRGAIHHIVY